jgi:hypothetical protein
LNMHFQPDYRLVLGDFFRRGNGRRARRHASL